MKFWQTKNSEYTFYVCIFSYGMKSLHKLIADHAKLLKNYQYAYISSTALFLLLPGYKGTPSDFDIAINWNGKSKKEFIQLYRYLKSQPWITKICLKTIENQAIANQIIEKNQNVALSSPLLNQLITQGNVRITYMYKTMPVELFPEQEGNGVTNIDVYDPYIHHIKINTTEVAVLNILDVAKRYVINFIDEVSRKSFAHITDPDYKHKDALRLNTIIQILYIYQKDTTPTGVLLFIKNYIKELKKNVPPQKRSGFIKRMLENYPKVYKKLHIIVQQYNKLSQDEYNGTKEVDFSRFHRDLKTEITKVYQVINLYQNHILHNLYIKKTNFLNTVKTTECKKIEKYLQKINLTNKINGFAYFYEVYSIINMLKDYK